MSLILSIILLIIFSFFLIKTTQVLIKSLNSIAHLTGLHKFALASILIGMSTSLPELFVGVTAALNQEQNLALGNILGSNIVDLSLVIGLTVIIGGRISIKGDFLKKDLLTIFLASSLPLFLVLDKTLSRIDGLLLILIFFLYNQKITQESRDKKNNSQRLQLLTLIKKRNFQKEIGIIFLAVIGLVVSAEVVVKSAVNIATGFAIPLFIIGLFLVAIGTSLPELIFEISAVKKKEMAMVFGDLLGSLVVNATLILGLTVLINPIKIVSYQEFSTAIFFFIVIFFIFWIFTRTKKSLERWEGLILLLIYALFVFLEVFKIR